MKLRFSTFSFILLLAALVSGAAVTSVRAADNRHLIVLELFTSEGCNSCPPADEYMNKLAPRPNLLALSWFIDYWNYRGWTDTYGRKENTVRQRKYNQTLGLAGVYTPQMIINGSAQNVGSHRKEVENRIKAAGVKPSKRATVSLGAANGQILVSLGAHDLKSSATVLLVGFKSEADVVIRGGELKGRTMHYANIVTLSRKLGDWNGKPQSYSQPVADLQATGADNYAVLVQNGDTGPIIGAARASLVSSEK